MILVTGATGQLGSGIIDHLIKKGIQHSNISALVRDKEKSKVLKDKTLDIRFGDYNDSDSLVSAFNGVDTLMLVSSNDREAIENRTAHHINAIKAAKEAKVKHIVYTSFVRKPEFETSAIADFQDSHVKTEQFLKESGIDYTILQNGIYMEMIPIFAGEKVAEKGIIMLPAEDGKASWVLRDELAEAAAQILTTSGHKNKTYVLTNTEAVTFGEIAKDLSNALGKEIQYKSPSIEDFESILKNAGVPEVYIGMFTMWASTLSEGSLDVKDDTLATFLGRKPTTVSKFIAKIYS